MVCMSLVDHTAYHQWSTIPYCSYKIRKKMSLLRRQGEKQQQPTLLEMTTQYEIVLSQNYDAQQDQLIQDLFEQIRVLSKELTHFKKETSQENMDRLVAEMRREKEKEREILENQWRQCNNDYKKMQEELKRLKSQNHEHRQDMSNLTHKITQFKGDLKQLKVRVVSGGGQQRAEFMTEPKSEYRSPYKSPRRNSRGRQQELQNKLLESQVFNYNSRLKLDNKDTIKSTIFMDRGNLNSCELSKTASTQGLPSKAFRQTCQAIRKNFNQHRQQNLIEFLERPQIRGKVFQILSRRH